MRWATSSERHSTKRSSTNIAWWWPPLEPRRVVDLAQVEVEDVAPVLPRGRAEVDVAAHPARARQRRVERLERHVARADEVHLLLAGPRRPQAQAAAADLRRDDVQGVQPR